jgi:hypothetical protein
VWKKPVVGRGEEEGGDGIHKDRAIRRIRGSQRRRGKGEEGDESLAMSAGASKCACRRGVFSESGKILYRDETCTTKAKRLTFLKEGVFFS